MAEVAGLHDEAMAQYQVMLAESEQLQARFQLDLEGDGAKSGVRVKSSVELSELISLLDLQRIGRRSREQLFFSLFSSRPRQLLL